jgi:hypothetical protein
MTNQKDIAKKQAEIVGQLQQFPIGRTNSGGRAGGTVEVVVSNPLPGQPRVVQAKCANDCPPGDVQLLKVDDGSYVALSPNAAVKTSETTTRQVSKKNPTIPKKDEEVWPVTSCFLYSKLKETQEDLTDNIATDLTSYDAWQTAPVTGSSTNERVILFTQRSDLMGDYETADDALSNNLKEDRKLKPGNTGAGSGGAADNAAWGAQSPDARIIWYYIGNPADILPNGKIFKVTGPPIGHPSVGNITNSGPGFVMQVYGSGIASAIFPSETMGSGPLTKHLKASFPNLGGQVGYAGRVERWRGQQDYASGISYFRNTPNSNTTPQTPVSFPPGYVQGSTNPWLATNGTWFQFGWPDPQYIGCASSAWINAESSALTDVGCGGTIPNNAWYWGGDATPYYGRIDKDNSGGYIGYQGMFVCWQGHKDNAGLAISFFEAFRDYWGIGGSVTFLGSVNPFGCGTGDPAGGGTGYPPPPPGLRRFLVKQYGRKAEIYLKVCEKDYPPIELKLPFEFAALIEKYILQGSVNINTFPSNQQSAFITLGSGFGVGFSLCLECPHATMSTDGQFVYIDILYGGERVWEDPLSKPIPCKLSNLGAGDFGSYTWYRQLANKERSALIVGEYKPPNQVEVAPRYKADYFTYCQSYKIALPTSSTDRTLTIVGAQRYRRGETIQLTAPSPDNEFNNKFLIYDFRTDKQENLPMPAGISSFPSALATWQSPNTEYASFGGLPALLQLNFPSSSISSLAYFNAIEKYYKPKSSWTDMDKIHFELQEAPETFYPLNTVLPVGVFIEAYTQDRPHVLFMLDSKFGRSSRAESISRASGFGYANSQAPTYRYSENGQFLLFTSFKEQLIGNGIKNNEGLVVKWNRVSTSSFPIFGQLKRNF